MPGTRTESGFTLTCGLGQRVPDREGRGQRRVRAAAGEDLAQDRDPAQDAVDRVGRRHRAVDGEPVGREVEVPLRAGADVGGDQPGLADRQAVALERERGRPAAAPARPCRSARCSGPMNDASETIRAIERRAVEREVADLELAGAGGALLRLAQVGVRRSCRRARPRRSPRRPGSASRHRSRAERALRPLGGLEVERDLAVLDRGRAACAACQMPRRRSTEPLSSVSGASPSRRRRAVTWIAKSGMRVGADGSRPPLLPGGGAGGRAAPTSIRPRQTPPSSASVAGEIAERRIAAVEGDRARSQRIQPQAERPSAPSEPGLDLQAARPSRVRSSALHDPGRGAAGLPRRLGEHKRGHGERRLAQVERDVDRAQGRFAPRSGSASSPTEPPSGAGQSTRSASAAGGVEHGLRCRLSRRVTAWRGRTFSRQSTVSGTPLTRTSPAASRPASVDRQPSGFARRDRSPGGPRAGAGR